MLLLAKSRKELSGFAKKEMESYCESVEELDEGVFKVESSIRKAIENSFLIKTLSMLAAEFIDASEAKEVDFKKFIASCSFKVKCDDRKICIELGQIIKDNTGCQVSLDNPDKTFIAEKIGGKYYCHLIVSGAEDLTQRGYASNNNEAISADYAKALIDFSGYSGKGAFLDSFCHEGYAIIECALKLLKVGPAYFDSKKFDFEFNDPKVRPLKEKLLCYSDSMPDLKFAKQNAKASKTFKFIDFGFATINDIDYTLKENSIDFYISVLPKTIDYEKLFFQLDYLMGKKGLIAILTFNDLNKEHEEYGFEIVEEVILDQGKKMVKMVRK